MAAETTLPEFVICSNLRADGASGGCERDLFRSGPKLRWLKCQMPSPAINRTKSNAKASDCDITTFLSTCDAETGGATTILSSLSLSWSHESFSELYKVGF